MTVAVDDPIQEDDELEGEEEPATLLESTFHDAFTVPLMLVSSIVVRIEA